MACRLTRIQNQDVGDAVHSQDAQVLLDQLRRDTAAVHSGEAAPSQLALLLPEESANPIIVALTALCGNGNATVGGIILEGTLRTILSNFVAPTKATYTEPRNPLTSEVLAQALRTLRIIQSEQLRPSVAHNALQPEIQQILELARMIPEQRAPYTVQDDDGPLELPRLPGKYHTVSRCYICKTVMHSSEKVSSNSWLCKGCAGFNKRHSADTDPQRFRGKIALVTGGRINLGFAVVLRLLRGGAKRVLVTTRFRVDAETRYADCPDYNDWKDRLHLLEADFVDAGDVTRLVQHIRLALGGEKLDTLINNAAQTVPIPRVERERLKMLEAPATRPEQHFIEAERNVRPYGSLETARVIREETSIVSVRGQLVKNSWTAHYDEIPYAELFTVLTVNSIVLFILVRELAELMAGRTAGEDGDLAAYVVNVSSREGTFLRKDKIGRSAHHVHTNMAKAAMNMITETLADEFQERGVYMNSVDPGYLSIQHAVPDDEHVQRNGAVPLTWEDGAARVLYPVVCGMRGKKMWGRFLKDYQERAWHTEYNKSDTATS